MIALLHGAAAYGAVEEYVASLATGLAERNTPAILVYPDVPELEPFASLAHGSLRTVSFPPELLSRTVALTIWLARTLRRENVRVAHVVEVWPPGTIAARLAGIGRVIVTHHTPELVRRDSMAGRLWWRLSWLSRPLIVYTSASDRQRDGRFLLQRRVVPLGIDVERFTVAPDRDVTAPIVGNVARLSHQKGQDTLLAAVPSIIGRHPTARFVFVGSGELRSELEEQAARLGVSDSVEFVGQSPDVPAQLARFSVFAFPSRFEGLCLAVIEAQMAGVPVVATAVGGIRETVLDGKTGLLVPVDDENALADAIVRLLNEPTFAVALATRAKESARTYSRDRTVRETLALYV